MASRVNNWQAWIERGEFLIAVHWKAKSVTIHYHKDGFDRMFMIWKYGVSQS